MKSFRVLAYVVVLSVLLGILASAAMADRVYCRPLLRDGRLIGFCFRVCNIPGVDVDPCYVEGCIWDLHLKIVRSNCMFEKIIRIPKGWDGTIGSVGTPGAPSPEFHAVTPPPTGGNPNPIWAGYCKDFCLRVTPRCISPGDCFRVRWVTTDDKGLSRDKGIVKCCWPAPVVGT